MTITVNSNLYAIARETQEDDLIAAIAAHSYNRQWSLVSSFRAGLTDQQRAEHLANAAEEMIYEAVTTYTLNMLKHARKETAEDAK